VFEEGIAAITRGDIEAFVRFAADWSDGRTSASGAWPSKPQA